MKNRGLIIVVFIMSIVLSACGQKELKDALDWPVQDFTYTNQESKSYGMKDLEGKVWVADFIFTNCEDVCLPMTSNMSKLQEMAKKEGIKNLEFVSFSVDPIVDTPEVLTKFADQFQADTENWNFLTGFTQQEIEEFAVKNFKTLVKKPEQQDQVIHGTDFYLVDQEGTIKKYYTGLNEIPLDEIMDDIKTLQ